jgi:hypothetical protein
MTDDDGERTVLEAVREELDVDELHGLAVTRRSGETWYLVAAGSTTLEALDDGPDSTLPVLDVRTVVVDLETGAVTPTDNGLWVPAESSVSEALTRLLGRSTTGVAGNDDGDEPAVLSAVEGLEPDWLLEETVDNGDADTDVGGQHVEQMKRHGGISPARSWGYGAGPPPEVETVVERLEAAGLDPADHLSRLVWGKKEPMDRVTRPLEELVGNYGIELQPREVGLVALDVDYPEAFPDDLEAELPETLEVSSPHGGDERRHILLRCDEKERVADELGAWAVQSVEWGDLWVGDRYLVGPGSQLSEFGCDHGPHERSEAGGCPACEDPDRGYYRIVRDAPIATVSAETVLDLVDDGEGELRDGQAAPDAPGEPDVLECHNCGAEFPVEAAEEGLEVIEVAGRPYQKCRAGCE